MTIVHTLGFPRIGAKRELKQALEQYWRGEIDAATLEARARALRLRHWQLQHEAGARHLPCGDFSLYDHVLDTALRFGAVPESHAALLAEHRLRGLFALARGHQDARHDLRALEMTKWFDTNYHYLVPELRAGQSFRLEPDDLLGVFHEARAAGFQARPVVLGPVSFLKLAKTIDGSPALELLDALLPHYAALFSALREAGAEWLQLDEPWLATDLDPATQRAFTHAFSTLAGVPRPKVLLASYFAPLRENRALALDSGFEALHLDLVRGGEDLEPVLAALPGSMILSAGLNDGRNVWRSDLDGLLATARRIADAIGRERLWLAPSCSLLHVPIDLATETRLDPELRSWLAFARQKIEELSLLATALEDPQAAEEALAAQRAAIEGRRRSARVHRPEVAERLRQHAAGNLAERAPYAERLPLQQERLGLPLFPTTTIGSFPQTSEIREVRAAWRTGKLDDDLYRATIREHIASCVREQETIGLDVLVHGEFERNDMVEYFGEQLEGFAFTRHGWVQSYGSRCVKPPIIWGDVWRPRPMTVEWSHYAQSLTSRPMKGMLTGPVTMLQWSFVRDDVPRQRTALQIALALREEVADLAAAGLPIVQIDEPALREGLPLRRSDWVDYLGWAVEAFRITAAGAGNAVQVHTHMCYSEFNDIIEAVAAMDADVVSIETSRSRMALLDAFVRFRYPSQIGPGVYDIHSPRIPTEAEMLELLERACAVIPAAQLWVNPDCGLKTRGWPETREALVRMVGAARRLRARLPAAAEEPVEATP